MAKYLGQHSLVVDALEGLRTLLDEAAPRLKKTIRKTGTLRVKNPKPPKSSVGRFHHLVFHHAVKVTSDFDCLEHIVTMLRKLPSPRTFQKWKFTPDKWLEYQYSLYLVTLVGTVDRCLQAVNAVLQLGLAPQDCTEHILSRHTRIAGTKLARRIKDISREMQPWRFSRNLDVHRKDLPPFNEIVGWDNYDWLPIHALLQKAKLATLEPAVLHRGFRYSGQLLAAKMQKQATRLKAQVWRMFDVLAPIAKRRVETLTIFNRVAVR